MKLFYRLVIALVALVLVVFAVANREAVTLDFWPLPISLQAPVYAVALLTLLAGFLIGELVAWINGHHWRREARRMTRRVEDLERALAERHPLADPKGEAKSVAAGPFTPPVSGSSRKIANN